MNKSEIFSLAHYFARACKTKKNYKLSFSQALKILYNKKSRKVKRDTLKT